MRAQHVPFIPQHPFRYLEQCHVILIVQIFSRVLECSHGGTHSWAVFRKWSFASPRDSSTGLQRTTRHGTSVLHQRIHHEVYKSEVHSASTRTHIILVLVVLTYPQVLQRAIVDWRMHRRFGRLQNDRVLHRERPMMPEPMNAVSGQAVTQCPKKVKRMKRSACKQCEDAGQGITRCHTKV